MKTIVNFLILLAAVFTFAACEPEPPQMQHVRNIVYTVDEQTTTVQLFTEEEFDALLDRFCDYAESGSSVSFYNANRATKGASKESVTYSTSSREQMKAWMRQMEDAGKTVTVTYDSNSGTYNGTAYVNASQPQRQEGCYTGVLVHEEFSPEQLLSLQVSADSILILHNNYTPYQDNYIELDGITYYVGDTVTLCGELEAEMYDTMLLFLNIAEPEPLWVDLGLPSGLLWASHNVGAERPEDYGDYFAWGETRPKSIYLWSSYKYCYGGNPQCTYIISNVESNVQFTKYCPLDSYGHDGYTDTLTILQPEDDAATANWGGGARTPTRDEWSELWHNCTVTWSTRYNLQGHREGLCFTGPNGNSIFIPAAGIPAIDEIIGTNSSCHYMTSTLYETNPLRCFELLTDSYKQVSLLPNYRYEGRQVRPVRSAD